jgi:allantoin racemase
LLNIAWILPVGIGTHDSRMLQLINKIRRQDVAPEVTHLSDGLPDNLEYHYFEHLVENDLLEKIVGFEKRGFSAAVIGCFYDGGLREARELVQMPVIGEEESSVHFASMIGHKFSIIAGRRKWIPKFEDNVKLYGLADKLASCRAVEYSIAKISNDRIGYLEAVKKEAEIAIHDDGAEVIVLSEEASFEFDDLMKLQKDLGVPILDPGIVAWKFAEMAGDLYQTAKLSHSKIAEYQPPPN